MAGFNGVSQAQALYAIMIGGYSPLSPLMQQPSTNAWICHAMLTQPAQGQPLYLAVVNSSGNATFTPI
jgi:hypothetical protein